MRVVRKRAVRMRLVPKRLVPNKCVRRKLARSRAARLVHRGSSKHRVAAADSRTRKGEVSPTARLSSRTSRGIRPTRDGYEREKRYLMVAAKVSPGRRMVDGNAGWFGASGKSCASSASPAVIR